MANFIAIIIGLSLILIGFFLFCHKRQKKEAINEKTRWPKAWKNNNSESKRDH